MEQIADNPQSVGADRVTCLGNLNDGVDQAAHRFGFRGSPGEFDVAVNIALGQIAARKLNQFRRDFFPSKILHRLNGRVFPARPVPSDRVDLSF